METVKRIANVTNAIEFLKTLEDMNRWSRKYIVLDCPTDMAKNIVVSHVRDLSLGRRTYHYLLSGLVSNNIDYGFCPNLFLLLCTFHFRLRDVRSCDREKLSRPAVLSAPQLRYHCRIIRLFDFLDLRAKPPDFRFRLFTLWRAIHFTGWEIECPPLKMAGRRQK